MIISHTDKYIFFAVPKTGTHAVRFALRPLLGEADEEQVGLYVKRKLSNPGISQIRHGHISCQQAKDELDHAVFNDYFKFGFVRNPYDRFVSYCFFMNRQQKSFARNPIPQMKQIIRTEKLLERVHLLPQAKLLCDNNQKLLLDYTGKYEHFQEGFDHICSSLDLSQINLEHVNASVHENWKQYYDDELRELVHSFYRKDFEMFGYQADF